MSECLLLVSNEGNIYGVLVCRGPYLAPGMLLDGAYTDAEAEKSSVGQSFLDFFAGVCLTDYS